MKTAEYGLNWGLQVFAICAIVTTPTAVAIPGQPALADGDNGTTTITVTELATTTTDVKSIFLPFVMH